MSSFAMVMTGAGASATTTVNSADTFSDPNPTSGDGFGSHVAISSDGSTAVVGSPGTPGGGHPGQGTAYVFSNNGAGWTLANELDPPLANRYDNVGKEVSISSDGSVISLYASGFSQWFGSGINPPTAYVYERPLGGWGSPLSSPAVLSDVPAFTAGNCNGGNAPLAGLATSSDGSLVVAGSALYTRPEIGWTGSITASAILVPSSRPMPTTSCGVPLDFYGSASAISGNGRTVAVGASGVGASDSMWSGSVFVFHEPDGGWKGDIQSSDVLHGDPPANPGPDHFGFSVSFSYDGNKLLVGSYGSASVFTLIDGNWSRQAILTPSDGGTNDFFGSVVSLSSDGLTALVGAPNHRVNYAPAAGAAYLFDGKSGFTSSTQIEELTSPNPIPLYSFGSSVSLLNSGQAFVGEDGYQGLAPEPTVTSITPNSAAPGQLITIDGTNLGSIVGISFGGNPDPGYGRQPQVEDAVNFMKITNTEIQVEVPPLAVSGCLVAIGAWTAFPCLGQFTVESSFGSSSILRIKAASARSHVPTRYLRHRQAKNGSTPEIPKSGAAYLFGAVTTQLPLSISNSSLIGSVGTPISLSTSGGSGAIAPTFEVTGAGCSISGALLSSTQVTTCVVTATNPASGNYLVADSSPVSFRFLTPQPALKIRNSKFSGVAGTAVTLTATGGTGSGVLSFSVTGANCTLSGTSLNATGLAQCVVTGTKAASGSYGPAVSPPVTFTFALATQAALKVSNSVKKGTVGTPLALTASGGSGSGLLSFSVTGSGCAINGQQLTATKAGNCSVQATKASSGIYAVAVSPAVVFTFTLKK